MYAWFSHVLIEGTEKSHHYETKKIKFCLWCCQKNLGLKNFQFSKIKL